ncbi:unnamed protein product [Tenebrio molitor]|jgi:hypothetical protein|nr:unnamed protein product [Tenebrio molitor]
MSKSYFDDDPFSTKGYEWGPSTYFSLSVIVMFTIIFVFVEVQRRKMLTLLNNGYYFVEEFVNLKQKRLVPVPPENVDTSDPLYPRIINPALIQQNTCTCCV